MMTETRTPFGPEEWKTSDMPLELAEHIAETYEDLEPLEAVITTAINIRELGSHGIDATSRHEAAVVLWQARRWLQDRDLSYGYNRPRVRLES